MMEAVRTSETSVENNFTRQYIPEDNSEHDKYALQLVCEQIYIYWFLDCLDKHEKPGSCWFYVALMNMYCGIN
jgi:hypothetical protein